MTNLLPNANICLKFDPQAASAFEKIAQESFQDIAYGYCLGQIAFPHVTLAQVHITSQEQKSEIQSWLKDQNFQISITLENFNISFHRKGVLWCHFSVRKSPVLISLQEKIDQFVHEMGLEPLNPSLANYHPHVTIARLKTGTPLPVIKIPEELIEQNFSTQVILGPSDKVGQLLGYELHD